MSLDNITGPETENAAPPPMGGAVLTITPAAAERIHHLLNQKQPQPEAVPVGAGEAEIEAEPVLTPGIPLYTF